MKFKPKYLAFAVLEKSELDKWIKIKANGFNEFRPVPSTYISVTVLQTAAENFNKSSYLIWQGQPGFMSESWVNEYRGKKERNYKFSTGLYKDSRNFLLVDDLFEWVCNQRKTKDVRSAFDIISAIKNKQLDI